MIANTETIVEHSQEVEHFLCVGKLEHLRANRRSINGTAGFCHLKLCGVRPGAKKSGSTQARFLDGVL